MKQGKLKLANSKIWGLTNKAFTLIELLAIIVILAIIAVITVPIILNIIENSRKGAAQDSAYGYRDAINKYYVTELANNRQLQLEGDYTVSNGTLNGSGIDNVTIPISGTIPSSGGLTYSNNTLTGGCLIIGDYAVTFDGGNVSKTEKGECKIMTKGVKVGSVQYYTGQEGATMDNSDNIVYFDPTNNIGKCTNYVSANSISGYNGVSPTAGQTSCLRWYIYSIDDKGTSSEVDDVVNMILDHNTTRDQKWYGSRSNNSGPGAAKAKLRNDTTGWTSNKLIAPSSYTASWIDNTTNLQNSGAQRNYIVEYTTNARLIEAEEVARIKGDILWTYKNEYYTILTYNNAYLKTNDGQGFWTSSPFSFGDDFAWSVNGSGGLTTLYVDFSFGIRPVISVLKSDVL